MKKILVTIMLLGLVLISSNAFAQQVPYLPYSFDAIGIVDPNFGVADNDFSTGTARYWFYFSEPSVSVTALSLEFEDDIFDLNRLAFYNAIAPIGWTVSTQQGFDGTGVSLTYVYESGAGIGANQDPIIVDVGYVLRDPDAYALASGAGWSWSEGQAWGQSYSLFGSTSQGQFAVGSGSTNPVPEPATMLLLGPALLGLVGFRKKA